MMVKDWNRLSREAAAASFLEVFKAWMDEALSSLVQRIASLSLAEGLDLDDF